MFFVIRAKRFFSILCLTILLFSSIILIGNRTLVPVFQTQNPAFSGTVYMIDAGHGGEDGGAVSSNGVIESTINLAVSRRLSAILCFLGENAMMTRENEQAVYSDDAVTLREKKRSDLENRVKMINRERNAQLISIHQNSMPSVPSVHGAQVFYNKIEQADELANQVQNSLNHAVNSENHKSAKPIDSSIYLMKNVQCPAILVECGFLSNAYETEALQDPNYQMKLAVAITAGLLESQSRNEA